MRMNGFKFPASETRGNAGGFLAANLLIGGVMVLLLLSGCQDGKGSGGGAVEEVVKVLHPPLVEAVRGEQPQEDLYQYDAESGIYYQAVPGFVWQGPLTEVDNRFANPAAYRYAGFAMQVETNENRPGPEQICSNSASIALYPPVAAVTRNGVVFDPIVGLGNRTVSAGEGGCGNEFFQLRALDDDGDGEWDRLQYNFPPGENSETLLTEAVPGEWQLRSGVQVLANFRLSSISPVQGKPFQLPMPVPRVNRDPESGLVESVDVRWWRYNPATADYEPVVDSDGIPRSVVELRYGTATPELHEAVRAYGLVERAVFPRYPWRLFDSGTQGTGEPQVTAVHISYEAAGIAYRFVWQAS